MKAAKAQKKPFITTTAASFLLCSPHLIEKFTTNMPYSHKMITIVLVFTVSVVSIKSKSTRSRHHQHRVSFNDDYPAPYNRALWRVHVPSLLIYYSRNNNASSSGDVHLYRSQCLLIMKYYVKRYRSRLAHSITNVYHSCLLGSAAIVSVSTAQELSLLPVQMFGIAMCMACYFFVML